MLGHDVTLSETNLHGWVPVCECGWIGSVHAHIGFTGDDTQTKQDRIANIRDSATAEHRVHLVEIEHELVKAHAVALDAHAGYVAAVRPTVKRLGRWGNG